MQRSVGPAAVNEAPETSAAAPLSRCSSSSSSSWVGSDACSCRCCDARAGGSDNAKGRRDRKEAPTNKQQQVLLLPLLLLRSYGGSGWRGALSKGKASASVRQQTEEALQQPLRAPLKRRAAAEPKLSSRAPRRVLLPPAAPPLRDLRIPSEVFTRTKSKKKEKTRSSESWTEVGDWRIDEGSAG
ncbi:hypothetical protein Esti_006720 [Eimeria stiedai]